MPYDLMNASYQTALNPFQRNVATGYQNAMQGFNTQPMRMGGQQLSREDWAAGLASRGMTPQSWWDAQDKSTPPGYTGVNLWGNGQNPWQGNNYIGQQPAPMSPQQPAPLSVNPPPPAAQQQQQQPQTNTPLSWIRNPSAAAGLSSGANLSPATSYGYGAGAQQTYGY